MIQGGINGASGGDTVMVHPGTYFEHDIDFMGKAITVMGTDPEDSAVVAETVVDASLQGGVFCFNSDEDSTSVLTGLTITGGLTHNGGGIYCNRSSPTIVNNAILSNRTSDHDGGGISCWISSPIIKGNIISGNIASEQGGGIACTYSSPNIEDNMISNNTAAEAGGGIFSGYKCYPIITGNTIISNTTTGTAIVGHVGSGGGISCRSPSSPTIINNTIKFNYARDYGGGISCAGASVTIDGNIITENSSDYKGGGINLSAGGNWVITDNYISNNSAHFGGGIHATPYSLQMFSDVTLGRQSISDADEVGIPFTIVLEYNEIIGNTASVDGGGMQNSGCSLTATKCSFVENSASHGGGMYEGGSNSTFNNCIFIGNSAIYDGGGMYNKFSNPILTNCTFSGNTAYETGAGMYNDRSKPIVINCTFNQNTTLGDGGGMYNHGDYVTECAPTVINCIFSENLADSVGGIFNHYNSNPTVTNSILWGDIGDEIYDDYYCYTTITYSDVEGGYTGEGNINADPRFITFKGLEYLLHPSSPCVDTGDPSIEDGLYDWHPKWPEWYPNGSRSDMGAYGGPGNVDWLPNYSQ
jgi:parallel beta-helix repeat protein